MKKKKKKTSFKNTITKIMVEKKKYPDKLSLENKVIMEGKTQK